MPILKQKPEAVEMLLYRQLPGDIKILLGGPENAAITDAILKEAGLSETYIPYINAVTFGLFVGELNPKDLKEGVKEWLALEDAKAQLVVALIKKHFVEPHKEFLEHFYNKKSAPVQRVPEERGRQNVVNLKTPNKE